MIIEPGTERRALREIRENVPGARNALLFAFGAGCGAFAMYLLDPRQGARRRAVLSDRATSTTLATGRRSLKLLRHLRNQAEGVLAYTTDLFTPVGVASDRKLADRIRSRLGHVCENPSRIELEVKGGDVIVRGHAEESEIARLLSSVSAVRGVRSVTDAIERGPAAVAQPIQ